MCSSLAPRNFHHLIDYGARAESAACCSTAMTCTTLRATGNAFVWTHPIQQTHNAMQKESSMTSVQRVPKCVGPCQKVRGQVPLSTSRTQRRKAQPHAVMWPKTAVAKNCTANKSQEVSPSTLSGDPACAARLCKDPPTVPVQPPQRPPAPSMPLPSSLRANHHSMR